MADIELGKYVNYPTYPSFGPWTNTVYERSLTEDYRIQEKNIPSGNIASRLDIFSSEYQFSAWLGPIVSLPSFILTGATYNTIVTLRCSYWNWLITGMSLQVDTSQSNGYSVIRPPTFHYQLGDKYKEVVHYGFEMILFGIVTSLGTIQIIRVESFVPFLEYREQAKLIQYLLDHGTVSSFEIDADSFTAIVGVNYFNEVSLSPVSDISNMNMSIYTKGEDGYKKVEYPVYSITEDGSLVVGIAFELSEGRDPFAPAGSLFTLDKPVQIENPATLYSEIKTGDKYWSETGDGFKTREQAIEVTSQSWTSIFYNPTIMADILRQKSAAATKAAEASSDTATVEEQQELASQYESEALAAESHDVVYDGMAEALNGEIVAAGEGDDQVGVELYKVIIREYKELQSGSVLLNISISGVTLSRHNFHADTQVGEYMFVEPNSDSFSAYNILVHPRNKLFRLSTSSSVSENNLLDLLLEDSQNFSLRSQRMWKMVDSTSNKSGGTTSQSSLDRGLYLGNIESAEYLNTDRFGNAEGNTEEEVSLRARIKYKVSENNYRSVEYMNSRFLTDIEADQVIKAWRQFRGWEIRRKGSEASVSYPIISIEVDSSDDSILYILLESTFVGIDSPEEFEDGAHFNHLVWSGHETWWIGFDVTFPIRPPFNYISAPFLGLDAVTGGSLTAPTITFDGIYVGSPLAMDIPSDQVVSLIEDNPAIFPNVSGVDSSLIKISSTKSFKYISYAEDPDRDSEFLIYSRDDDTSNALYVRRGRVDFMYDQDEFMIHLDRMSTVNVETTGNGSTNQILTANQSDVQNKDILSVEVVKSSPGEIPESDSDGVYKNTIWQVYHGDRLMGHKSTTGNEYTVYTRALQGSDMRTGIDRIPFYKTAEYFARLKKTEYRLAGNNETGDSLVGSGNVVKFVPVLNGNDEHAKFGSAAFNVIDSNLVVRDAKNCTVFPYHGGTRVVVFVQPQSSYVDGSEVTDVKIVKGTESDKESANKPPDKETLSILEDGVFMLSTTDSFRTFNAGIFADSAPDAEEGLSGKTVAKYPFLLSRNISECSYFMSGSNMEIAGYSKVRTEADEEVLSIVYREVNLEAVFRNPIFAYYADDDVVALWSDINLFDNIVVGNASTDDVTPGYVLDSLDISPLALASSPAVKFIIFQDSASLIWAITTSAGRNWSFYDDIRLTPSGIASTSPVALIWRNWLMLMYIADGVELRFRKISVAELSKFHKRYMENKKSSDEENKQVDTLKQELQTLIDNSEDTKVADTFDQQVSFRINQRNNMHVVFYDEDGYVRSAQSTMEGREWNLSPLNF